MLITNILTILVTCIVLFISFWKWAFQYWRRRNVPYLEPKIPFGNVTEALTGKEHYGVNLQRIYNEMKARGWKYGGIYVFGKPHYFPVDLDQVRNVLTKDFQYFEDRSFFFNSEPLQNHLFNLRGNKWRNLRSKLTPTFTPAKMKSMFQVMADCETVLHRRIDEEIAKNQPIDIKEVLACFATNIIGTCAFGCDSKALETEDSPFRVIGRQIVSISYWNNFNQRFKIAYPQFAKFLTASICNNNTTEFITRMVHDTISYREKNKCIRNDLMQLLINLKNKPGFGDHDGKPLTMNELMSQCFVFFLAGFGPPSTLMTFALYQLSKNQDIQDRVREEIRRVLSEHGDKITYDSIQDMKYLNQVLDETLRLHPPILDINRKCVKDYKVPGIDLVIKKGTDATISILGIHNDPEYYPDPTRFDPERFSDENKSLRDAYAYLPFGEGPRSCIGTRFGILQCKMGLVGLLRNYKFTVNEKTQEPVVYTPASLLLAIQGDLWLNAQKL